MPAGYLLLLLLLLSPGHAASVMYEAINYSREY